MNANTIKHSIATVALLFLAFTGLVSPARAQLPPEIQAEVLLERGHSMASEGNWIAAFESYRDLFDLQIPVAVEASYYYAKALSEVLLFKDAKEELSLYFEHTDRQSPVYRDAVKLAAYLNDKPDNFYYETSRKLSAYSKTNRDYNAQDVTQAKASLGWHFLDQGKLDEAEKWLTMAVKEGHYSALVSVLRDYASIDDDSPYSTAIGLNKGKALMLEIRDYRPSDITLDLFEVYFLRPEGWRRTLRDYAKEGTWPATKLVEKL